MTSYSQKLRDPRWQKKRLEILNRDEWTCQWCEDKETELHVHHEEYKGEPWEADNNKLKAICKDCHGIIHLKNLRSDIKIIKCYNKISETLDITIICKTGYANYAISNNYIENHSLSVEQFVKIHKLYKENNVIK